MTLGGTVHLSKFRHFFHCELVYWQSHQCHLSNCKRFEPQGP